MDVLYRDRSLTWNHAFLLSVRVGFISTFKKYVFGLYFANLVTCLVHLLETWLVTHRNEWKLCEGAQHEEQVVVLPFPTDAQVQGRIWTAWDDLNCLSCGMWLEECLGLPLGLWDFTQELSSATCLSVGCGSFTHLTVLVTVWLKRQSDLESILGTVLKYKFLKGKKSRLLFSTAFWFHGNECKLLCQTTPSTKGQIKLQMSLLSRLFHIYV